LFVLRDPASQELLAAVEKERLLKTRNISSSSPISIHHSHDDFHSEEVRQSLQCDLLKFRSFKL
jgi:E3 ubiquitin-protein ligase RHF